jgi:hypothetical protein
MIHSPNATPEPSIGAPDQLAPWAVIGVSMS